MTGNEIMELPDFFKPTPEKRKVLYILILIALCGFFFSTQAFIPEDTNTMTIAIIVGLITVFPIVYALTFIDNVIVLILGIILEVLYLYIVSCILVWLWKYIKSKTIF